MSDRSNLDELIGDLRTTLQKIERVAAFYNTFKTDVADLPKGKPYDLIVLADIFTDAYTCIETGFIRVSKFFENNLDRDRWHSHLIEKMTVEIPNTRPRVIADETLSILQEFLKFRHFRRYYFEFEYDRKRMDYLDTRLPELIGLVRRDLGAFIVEIERMREAIG